jgi:DNA (cytosine-5)-methyltransferase 1
MARRTGKHIRPDVIRSDDLPTARGEVVRLPPRLDAPDGLLQWQTQADDPAAMIVVDLFCGCGGMSLGFEHAGMFIAAGIDSDPVACETFAGNFLSKTLCLNLKTSEPQYVLEQLGLPRVDVVIGGPPCQGFSVLGRARVKKLSQEQQADIFAQNDMYQHFFRFIDAMQPLMFVMENVPEFKTFQRGRFYHSVASECERLGYEYYENMLASDEFGVPQVRRRLFIVGSRIGRGFLWPKPTHASAPITLREAIGDLPRVQPPQLRECLPYEPTSTSEYALLMRTRVRPEDKGYIFDHVVRPVREDDREIFIRMQPGDYYRDIDVRYKRYDHNSFHDRYHMLDPEQPSTSITAHIAKDGYRYIHWEAEQHRTLSVREAARVQSFDDHFRFAGYRTNRYRQIGNAVPPLLAKAIGHQVRRTLMRHREGNDAGVWQLGLPGFEHRTELVRSSTG